jgi:hypothetical protein
MTAPAKRPNWSTPLPQPIKIPQVMTLKTLSDVRKLLGHIPKERRQLSNWRHVEATLQACALGEDTANISVALRLVLQAERVPYTVRPDRKGRTQ